MPQIVAVHQLIRQRAAKSPEKMGTGSLLKYATDAFPEIDRERIATAIFEGKATPKVFNWTKTDLAVLLMNLGYFVLPPAAH